MRSMTLQKVAAKYTPKVKVKFIKSGTCYATPRAIEVFKPHNRAKLFNYLHECAHHVLVHHKRSEAVYNEEYEADQYTRRVFREEGLKIPPKTDKIQRAYVGECIFNALSHGAKIINPEAYKYAFNVDLS
jgi:hypothetical protein